MISIGLPEPVSIPNLCESIFRKGGLLEEKYGLEHRDVQQDMSLYCAQSFSADSPLIFEAGTGVGKSLAYLIPGIIAAKLYRRPLVVSTHTIALQHQILRKELPRIKKIFSECAELKPYADFKFEILLGRSNYLCTGRLKRAMAEKIDLFDTEESKALEEIANWALTTKTGLVEELPTPINWDVWGWVNADSSSCSPKKCADGTCFYQNARRRVSTADVVIINHSLLFSMLASGVGTDAETQGVLFAKDMCVLDEAHLLADVAAEHFGLSLNSFSIMKELRRIYDPRKKRGIIARHPKSTIWDKTAVSDALAATEDFFSRIRANFLTSRDTVALNAPEWEAPSLNAPFENLAKALDKLSQDAKSEAQAEELKDFSRAIMGIKNAAEEAIFLSEEKQVYWLERSGKDGLNVQINSAPLDPAPILRELLFSKGTSVILSSATLATANGNMDDFASSVGALGVETHICKSPFDYQKNMRVIISSDSPEPHKESKKLECSFLSKNIEILASKNSGGTLVLFTGYFELRQCAEILRSSDLLSGRKIFMQGEFSRNEMLKEFEKSKNAILLGTDSFWTGVDIPGDALSLVIITRLPFDNPQHPLLSARIDRCSAEGENPFNKITIPKAIIKFRQGVGRLIRSKTDKGVIAILDSRILTKFYGKNFIASLPNPDFIRFDIKNLAQVYESARGV